MNTALIKTTGIDKDKVLKHFRENSFYENVIDLIVDVNYINIKVDKLKKTGYHISIMQGSKESGDIRLYFTDRFRRKFSKRNKFTFVDYSDCIVKDKVVSMVRFYYQANLFERKVMFNTT